MALCINACSNATQNVYSSFEQKEYFREFERNIHLIGTVDQDFEEIGNNSIRIVDSIMVVGHNDRWSFVSLNTKKTIANCLSIGQGPTEFSFFIPSTLSCAFYSDNDSLFAILPNRFKNQLFTLNVTTLLDKKECYLKVTDVDYDLSVCRDILPMDKRTIMFNKPNEEYTSLQRFIITDNKQEELQIAKNLCQTTISPGEDLNLVSSVIQYNSFKKRFVEAMIYSNQIHIYSCDEPFAKTLIYGNKVTDMTKVQNTELGDRVYTYDNMATWDMGFGVIWLNENRKEFSRSNRSDTIIHIFNWVGKPLVEVSLDRPISSFDIDFRNKILYAIDKEEDILLSYNADELIKYIQENE